MIRLIFVLLVLATSAFAQAHSVTLNWTWGQGSGDMATGFHVQRATVTGGPYATVGSVSVTSFSYQDASVVGGVTYFYVITAYNASGDSPKSPEARAIIPLSTPAAPSSLTATVQ